MTYSMTAYASRTGSDAGASWVWEMRGVNARGLDMRLRLPEGLDGLEMALRTAIKTQFQRGNISISLRLGRDEAKDGLQLDEAQLGRVLAALDQVQERAFAMGVTLGQPTAADVLSHRGVVMQGNAEAQSEALLAALKADIDPLLADFAQMRAQEGSALEKLIAGHLRAIAALVDEASRLAEARKPDVAQALRDNMAKVLTEVAEVDEDRLAQELALLAVKQDVTEELDRLRTHIAAAETMLADKNPMGRKLDFLAQEFNREANTLCAKSQNGALTSVGLEIKALIDQMREQVQNVE